MLELLEVKIAEEDLLPNLFVLFIANFDSCSNKKNSLPLHLHRSRVFLSDRHVASAGTGKGGASGYDGLHTTNRSDS